ncbi:MAG: hypothetical protein ACFNWZ_00410 [Candidatus Absconditicoccaceae bacterium]
MMNIISKKMLLATLLVVSGGIGAVTLAQVDVKSNLTNAVQNIQKVYFTPDGLPSDDEILVEAYDGLVKISGRVLLEKDGDKNLLTPQAGKTFIIQGKENTVYGKDSFLLGGKANLVSTGAMGSSIVGGYNGIMGSGSQNGTIIGGRSNSLGSGVSSAIIGGSENKVKGSHSFIGGGTLTEINGDGSFGAGKNVKAATSATDRVFLWSDNYDKWRLIGGQRDLAPTTGRTFLIRSLNGIGIGTNDPQLKQGVDVNGLIQIGDEVLACGGDAQGAMRYRNGCFCNCNGATWVAMNPSAKCLNVCRQ